MTLTRGVALLLTVATASALLSAAGTAERARTPAGVRLKTISSRVSSKGASLIVEATEPVAYFATRPDPLTVVVEFRNVAADGVDNSAAASARGPIGTVAVEPSDAMGELSARVRVTLTQPVAYRVRSDRNTVVIDFDKFDSASPSAQLYLQSSASKRDATPDAMRALQAETQESSKALQADPVSALGLLLGSPAPVASRAPSSSLGSVSPMVPVLPELQSSPLAQSTAPARAQPPAAPAPTAPGTRVNGAQTGTSQPTPNASRRFTGHPISLDFQGADLRAVLRTFSEISGLNIVIDPAVTGTVDVALRDVPWDQALDIILRANKLGYLVDGTIVRIAPLITLAEEESQRRKLSDEQALSGTLEVLTKTLSYAKAEELQTLLTKSALSPRGTVQVDQRTNTLIISDLPDKLGVANDLITTLDRPQRQVEIEARIVQANKNYARALGIQWGFNGAASPTLGNTTNLAFPNSVAVGGRTGGTQGPATTPTGVNLPVPAATSAVGLALGSINGAFNLDMALSAAETSGNLRVLSTPRVSAQNNGEAEITQGVQIPIQTVANNTVTVSFKDAALTLKVTPQITAADTVIMKIQLENAQPDFSRAVNGIPPINTQRANTQVLVSDGQTTVIGGIFVSQEQSLNDRTPGLGSIPLLKWLFKRDTLNDQSTELLIFITPRIIKN
jgi:type IV pilus assembly protein PilQ